MYLSLVGIGESRRVRQDAAGDQPARNSRNVRNIARFSSGYEETPAKLRPGQMVEVGKNCDQTAAGVRVLGRAGCQFGGARSGGDSQHFLVAAAYVPIRMVL